MSLRRNTLWNLAGTGFPFLLGAITIPYLLKRIGIEAFGLLSLVWALIGYFSLFDFGLGRALTQQVSTARAMGKQNQLPSLIKTGLSFTVLAGVFGGVVLAMLSDQLAMQWLKVSEPLQASTVNALLIAAIGIPLTTVTTGLRGVLEAYEDFKIVNILRIALGAANFGLPALSVMFLGDSLAWMVASLVAARFIALIAHVWLVNKKLPAGWMFSRFDQKNLRHLLSFGAWMTLSNIISPLMVTADRFLISSMLGASIVAYYTVPFEVLIRVLVIPGALTSAFFPKIASLISTDLILAKNTYNKSAFFIFCTLLPIVSILIFSSHLWLSMWINSAFADRAWSIAAILAIGILFNGMAQIPHAVIEAAGKAKTTAFIHLAELIIYSPILYFSLKYFGIMGAAFAWTFRAFMDYLMLQAVAKKIFI